MRDQPLEIAQQILIDIAKGFDGKDRSYLEAFGTGATGKEAELYTVLKKRPRRRRFPAAGPKPSPGSPGGCIRLRRSTISPSGPVPRSSPVGQRQLAMDALAFINSKAATEEMLTLAQLDGPLKAGATWWLLNRGFQ